MIHYLSILRGINVGGHKKILMKDLKALYETLGFCEVSSYIQSGNILFKSDEENTQIIRENIERAIVSQYGFDVPVLIRTSEQIEKILEHQTFKDLDVESEGALRMITFLGDTPSSSALELLKPYLKEDEFFEIKGCELYAYFPNGYRNTKLTNNLIEKKLQTSATTRNYKTMLKLHELFNKEGSTLRLFSSDLYTFSSLL